MKKIMTSQFLIALALILISLFSTVTSAAEMAYYVQPVLPENQNKATVDFFDFETTVASQQTLQILVVNESEEAKELVIQALDAFTSPEGSISYDVEQLYDSSLVTKFSESVSFEEQLIVPGRSQEVVDIQLALDLPSTFEGIMLGAINVAEKQDSDIEKGGVANIFAYNVPVKIRVTKNELPLQLNYSGLTVQTEKLSEGLQLSFQNPVAEIIRELTLTYKITLKGQREVMFEERKEDQQLAPNSLFQPVLSLKDQPLKAGDYTLNIKGVAEGVSEEWSSDFTISKKQSDLLNNGFEVANRGSGVIKWVIIIGVIVLVIGGSYYGYRKQRLKG